jgi:hypothetical protein
MRDKERHKDQNRSWYYKIRARGICYLCKKPIADDIPTLAHPECNKKQNGKHRNT